MESFREFIINEFKLRGIVYRPGYMPSNILPKTGIRMGGAAHMNVMASVKPSRPYQPNYRLGKSALKSQITLNKH
jgi:hypothetical protein